MRYTIAAISILFALFQASVNAQQPGLPVVFSRSIEFVNQTAPLTSATLFTPSATGVYRVNAYIELTQITSVQIQACPSLYWTDDSMTPQENPTLVTAWAYSDVNCAGNYLDPNRNASASGTTVIRALTNTPVLLSVRLSPQPAPGAPPYSIYITVDKLSPAPGSN